MTKQRQSVEEVPGRAGQGASATGLAAPTTGEADAALRGWRRARPIVIVTVFTLIALVVAVWALVQHRSYHDYRLLAWGALAVAVGFTSGGVFEFGLRRRVRVDEVQNIDWSPVVWRVLGISFIVTLLACSNLVIDRSQGTARGVILTVLAIVGGTPALMALLGIKWAILITSQLAPTETARRLQAYLELRSVSRRLLSALGSLVALTTFALGAAGLAVSSGKSTDLSEIVITFGALATALVGLVYAIPNQALRAEARALLKLLAPLASEDPATLRQELGERENLERQLGLTATLMSDLQAGIAILGPLLAAAIALALHVK